MDELNARPAARCDVAAQFQQPVLEMLVSHQTDLPSASAANNLGLNAVAALRANRLVPQG